MKKTLITLLTLSSSLLFSSLALAECLSPSAPTIPDGSIATKEEMLSAKTEIEIYQVELYKYRNCLKEQQASIPEDAEDAEEKIAFIVDLHDTSVAVETAVANSFNNAISLFNTANKE